MDGSSIPLGPEAGGEDRDVGTLVEKRGGNPVFGGARKGMAVDPFGRVPGQDQHSISISSLNVEKTLGGMPALCERGSAAPAIAFGGIGGEIRCSSFELANQ